MQHITKHTAFVLVLIAIASFSKAQTTADTTSKLTTEKSLQTVTVTSKKPFIVLTAEKTTLNVAQSPIAAGSNVYEIIKKAPGVAEQSDALSYKGKSTKVLINGRPANLSGEDLKNMLSSMPGSNVEKVELISNPSAKYDAQGGAVINIILQKNKAYGTNYVLTTGIGTGKYIKTNEGIDINHRAKDINIYGGYSFNHNMQYIDNSSTRFLTNGTIAATEYDERARNNNTYKIGLDYDLNKRSSIGFVINGFLNYRDRDVNNASVLHYNNNLTDSTAKVFTKGVARTSGPLVNAYYKTTFDSTGKELTLNADYMNYNKKWDDNFTNKFYDAKGDEYLNPTYISNNSPAVINVYSFTADYVQPTKKGKWEAGIKTSYTVTDNNVLWQNNIGSGWLTDAGKTNHFIYKELVNAGYLNYSTNIKKWSIQAGLRAELTNTTGNSVTLDQTDKQSYLDLFPNIGVQYNKNDNNQFGFNYRKSINRYGFSYVNPFIIYQNQYAYSKGNPDLQPELSHSFELSYTFKQAYSLSFDYIHGTRTLGETYLQGANNTTISSYGNYRSSDIAYASLSVYQPLTKYWVISVNPMVGFMKLNNSSAIATNTDTKNVLITQVNWMNNFVFAKKWNAELTMMYLSPFQYGSYKTQTLFSTDFGISKSIMKSKASLKLAVSDIFNTLVYNKEVNYAGVITSLDQKQESRYVNLVFRYKFGNKNVKAKSQRASKVSDIQNRLN
jgi:hypothetical protein